MHEEGPRYATARERGDFDVAAVIAGEALDLVHDTPPAQTIIERMVSEASRLFADAASRVREPEPASKRGGRPGSLQNTPAARPSALRRPARASSWGRALARAPPERTRGRSVHYAMPMATSTAQSVSEYDVAARSTDVFGRVLCGVRGHHYVIDGPVQNGAPGEEVTPVEAFLSAVAACGVELIQAIARKQDVPLRGVAVKIHGVLDRANQGRTDVRTLNSVALDLTLTGVTDAEAAALVDGFKHL
jgi:uncharacterized OsmC-like protein